MTKNQPATDWQAAMRDVECSGDVASHFLIEDVYYQPFVVTCSGVRITEEWLAEVEDYVSFLSGFPRDVQPLGKTFASVRGTAHPDSDLAKRCALVESKEHLSNA